MGVGHAREGYRDGRLERGTSCLGLNFSIWRRS